ncbi:MAG: hypothetical protein FJ395_09460 [Verrucomicrobia bacterium]|nr:hypothetical protein [Verrucomicrobiota bacterium]
MRIRYAPNYWQWFTHHQHHGLLPTEIAHCKSQLEMIRWLGLDVFSRNIYCAQTERWFGGLADEIWDGVEVEERRSSEGRDIVTEKNHRLRNATVTEQLRYIFAESTLVQEKFLLDETPMEVFVELVRARRWRFRRERFEAIQREAGPDGVVIAGELFSPLKLLHFAAGADKAVYLLADYPELCREAMAAHEAVQLDLVRQMIASGVRVMMSMDNLDTMFHPPHYVEQYSASFYEKAARLCHENGAAFFIHACGQQRALLPLIGSLGVDGLEGVTPPPLGDVALDEAMRLSGDRLIITGGISAAEFRRLTTRQAVFDYVGELFARMKPFAHRFVFSASCNTPYTAPWETIKWFRDAWKAS